MMHSSNFLELGLLDEQDKLKLSFKDGKKVILDPLRRLYVKLTPEELVRQLLIQWLISKIGVGTGRMITERGLQKLFKGLRFDLAVYDKHLGLVLLAECKSFRVPLNESAIDQLSKYNLAHQAKFLLWTNGKSSLLASWDGDKKQYVYITDAMQAIAALRTLAA
jgi:hypothetical protein